MVMLRTVTRVALASCAMGLAAGGVCAVGAVLRGVCRLRSASRCRLPASGTVWAWAAVVAMLASRSKALEARRADGNGARK